MDVQHRILEEALNELGQSGEEQDRVEVFARALKDRLFYYNGLTPEEQQRYATAGEESSTGAVDELLREIEELRHRLKRLEGTLRNSSS